MTKVHSRAIPEPIKRAVRQRCGFGCVLCGNPIYEYDHIVEYAEVKEHTADNLTLLCREHHGEKTLKLLTREQVSDANQDPFNFREGVSKQQLLNLTDDMLNVKIGPTTFRSQFNAQQSEMYPIVIKEEAFVSFTKEDGVVSLSLVILDDENNPILVIRKNALEVYPDSWDVEYISNRLTIRTGSRQIVFKMSINPPNNITIDHAAIGYNDAKILVTPEEFTFEPPRGVIRGKFITAQVGIYFGANPPKGGCGIVVGL